MARGTFAGVDLGATFARLCILRDGAFVASERRKATEVVQGARPVASLAGWIGERLEAAGARPASLGIGLPVVLDRERARVLSSPNLPALQGARVAEELGAALGFPVFAERDVNLQLFHDLSERPRAPRVAVGCYLGTGLGCGVWIDRLFLGAHGGAAELGHIPVLGLADPCGCGQRGCVETACSGWWLRSWLERHAPGAPIEDAFRLYAAHPDLRRLLEVFAHAVAIGVNLFDPELLVLGGGVLALSGFPLDELIARVRARTRTAASGDALEVAAASSAPDGGARGACLFARYRTEEGEVRRGG